MKPLSCEPETAGLRFDSHQDVVGPRRKYGKDELVT
jgi:hypothetical protein